MLRENTVQGRRFARVRVVTLPLTDYSRFGVWCAQFTTEPAKTSATCPGTRPRQPGSPITTTGSSIHGCWYACTSTTTTPFLGGEVIEDSAEIVRHNYWRDAAWHHAVRRDDFATQQHIGRV